MRLHLILTLPLLAGRLAAQQAVVAPQPSVLFDLGPVEAIGDTLPAPATSGHRGRIGAAIGGIVGAGLTLTAYALGSDAGICNASLPQYCQTPNGINTGTVVAGALSGAALGYFVGHSLKGPSSTLGVQRPAIAPARPRTEDTGMTWYQGALLGAGVGGLGAVLAAKSFQWDQRSEVPAIAFLPLGAIIGLVVGGSLAQAH